MAPVMGTGVYFWLGLGSTVGGERGRRVLAQPRTRLVVVAILAIAIAVVLAFVLSGAKPYEVKVELTNASQLVKGNRVTVAGEAVGEVARGISDAAAVACVGPHRVEDVA